MQKQFFFNTLLKRLSLNYSWVGYLAFLFLLLGMALPSFAQDSNPCSSIQVIGSPKNGDISNYLDYNTYGRVFQGILVRNEGIPNQIVKIYNENLELIRECNNICGNPYTFPTGEGKYFVQVSLFNDNDVRLCQSESFEVTVAPIDIKCRYVTTGGICSGNIRLTTQAEVDAFCPCTIVDGNMIIGQENENDITSIENLKSIKTINGFLAIFNTQLTNLQGLENLETIETIEGHLVIAENKALKNLVGLSKLATVNNFIFVDSNPAIESLAGLSALSNLEDIKIHNNPKLTDISALINTDVNYIFITGNASLTNLEGLNNTTQMGSSGMSKGRNTILIAGNPALTNLDALSNIQLILESVLIEQNNSLTDCCGIAHLIDTDPNNRKILGKPKIIRNRKNCNSIEEILANCRK